MPREPVGDAVDLARGLPALLIESRRLAAALVSGGHRQRRAGLGDEFWQVRPLAPGEERRAIDWRASARADRWLARERERAQPSGLAVWVDFGPGMNWSGDPARRPAKAARGLTVALAVALAARGAGERVRTFGGTPFRDLAAFAAALVAEGAAPPRDPGRWHGGLLWAGDPAEPADRWQARVAPFRGLAGCALLVCDPDERDFPYGGARIFAPPGGPPAGDGGEMRLGRAEAAAADYRARWRAACDDSLDALASAGMTGVLHTTDAAPLPVGLAVLFALAESAGRGHGIRSAAP